MVVLTNNSTPQTRQGSKCQSPAPTFDVTVLVASPDHAQEAWHVGGAKFKSAAILAGGLRGSRTKRIWTVVAMAPGSKCKLRSCLVSSSPLADAGAMGHHLLGR